MKYVLVLLAGLFVGCSTIDFRKTTTIVTASKETTGYRYGVCVEGYNHIKYVYSDQLFQIGDTLTIKVKPQPKDSHEN